MIPYRNCEIFASVLFYFTIKLICSAVLLYRVMYKRQPTLTSIPERNENEEDDMTTKWVPKKKHEVLKAKYKCLKKLFQVYDASVIGILPESYGGNGFLGDEIQSKRHRRKRSHRAKVDASAGTTDSSSGNGTQVTGLDTPVKETIATAVIRDLNVSVDSKNSRENINTKNDNIPEKDSKVEQGYYCAQKTDTQSIPYVVISQKPKMTRFQSFIHRIFGIRPDTEYILPNGHVYAASDSNIYNNYCEKRRRGGLRFRRMKRPKKIQSESALGDIRSPTILTYVQSVQKNYLNDNTPRQCPIIGCQMRFFGIINYNDHLNFGHFPNKKFVCHYCHEGFEKDYEKFLHENEHLGIGKLSSRTSSHSGKQSQKISNDTQTDQHNTVQQEVGVNKLKKNVSFYEKVTDSESTVNLRCSTIDSDSSASLDKRPGKPWNFNRNERFNRSSRDSSGSSNAGRVTPAGKRCHVCGEHFDNRSKLSYHVLSHDKFSDYQSCNLSVTPSNYVDMIAEDGKIKVQSIDQARIVRRISSISSLDTDVSRFKSDENCSTYASTKKSSVVHDIVKKVKTGMKPYKWEAGTKIIRV